MKKEILLFLVHTKHLHLRMGVEVGGHSTRQQHSKENYPKFQHQLLYMMLY